MTVTFNPPNVLSDQFQLALRDGQTLRTHADIIFGAGQDPIDVTPYWVSGSVQVGSDSIRRSSSDIVFTDIGDGVNVVPKTPDDLLAPYGNQLRLWAGIEFPNGDEEYTPVGTLRIISPQARYPRVQLTAKDLAWVAQAPLEESYTIPAGTNTSDAIRGLLQFVAPDVAFDIPDVAETTPLMIIDAQEDPWSHIRDLASSVGHDIYFDAMGTCIMRPVQDLIDIDPVWTYDGAPADQGAGIPYNPEDWANLALYDESVTYDSDDAVNAVVATGESTANAAPARGVAYDTDSASPTQYGGRFGRRPGFISSPLYTTDAQAHLAARTHLQKVVGIAESLTIPASTHPGLEPGNPVRVVRPNLGLDTIQAVDGFNVPLGTGGAQTLQTRQRRIILGQV